MNEQCWILVGENRDDLWWGKRVQRTEGEPCLVQFDPYYVLERDEKYGDVVGFIHTHPNFSAHYSGRDDLTMKAWVACLGKPLVCCIVGSDGLRAWWYENDEDRPEEFDSAAVEGLVFGVTPYEIIDREVPLPSDIEVCFHCGKIMEECKCD